MATGIKDLSIGENRLTGPSSPVALFPGKTGVDAGTYPPIARRGWNERTRVKRR